MIFAPPLSYSVVTNEPVDDMDLEFLDDNSRLRALFPASAFQPYLKRMPLWCHRRARYGIPTLELVTWLRARIAGRRTIEIASGNGDLGYLLGVNETDSYLQADPQMRDTYLRMGQNANSPGLTVKKYDAIAAIRKFRPQVVVASWFTRKFEQGVDKVGESSASIYGVREEEIIQRVETYIHFGSIPIHGSKSALTLPHEEIRIPGLVSRTADQNNNILYVWDNPSPRA